MASDERKRLCLNEGYWMAFDRSTPDGHWTFIGTVRAEEDNPSTAARKGCIEKWASGTHDILVVSLEEAHQFRVTIETEPA
jgi:hypothetical protein